jgi:small membrane protein
MIMQTALSLLLTGIVLYAWAERRRSPLVGLLSMFAALAGMYLVWIPAHATVLAEMVGVGRGVDLILYIWVVISLLLFLNLHLKLRAQLDLITTLARAVTIANASRPSDAAPRVDEPAALPAS